MTNQKTGLFTATVGAFIIESYKYLSPNPNVQTVVLLVQISQQLAGFNGTYPNLPTTQVTQPSSPSTSIIIVNAMWLMSLVLSITSALLATLLQQWARRYKQMPENRKSATSRARVRSYLFLGTLKYKMDLAVETVPTLLHLSVFLFFIGLVIFFFPINKAVAIAVSASVGVFAGIYFVLTILPFAGHDLNCPYRTPISTLLWYPWHALLSFGAFCLREIVNRLHGCSVPSNDMGQHVPSESLQYRLMNWSRICEAAVKKHHNRLKKGFEESVIQGALDAPVDADREAISRLFSQLTLADKSEIPDFVASIPKGQIVQLMTPPIDSGKIDFHEPLILLRSCVVDTDAAGLGVEARKRCVVVCFEFVNHVLKTILEDIHNEAPQPEIWSLLDEIRTDFASIDHIRRMWKDNDAAIRVTARSICALLAGCLIHKPALEAAELGWLAEVLGKSSHEIYGIDDALLYRINLESFVRGILPLQEGDKNLRTEYTISFTETLANLMGAGRQAPFDPDIFSQGISDLIDSMQEDGPQGALMATELRHMFRDFLPSPAPSPTPSPSPAPSPIPLPSPVPEPTPHWYPH